MTTTPKPVTTVSSGLTCDKLVVWGTKTDAHYVSGVYLLEDTTVNNAPVWKSEREGSPTRYIYRNKHNKWLLSDNTR